jgi:hypothetical protein
LLRSIIKPLCNAAILLPTGREGTGGFGLATTPWSDPLDLADEFDGIFANETFSEELRVTGFEGRAGTCGLVFTGRGGEAPSPCRNLSDGRAGTTGCVFSGDSADFALPGRAGIIGFVVAAIPVVARPSSLPSGNPAAAFSW